MSKIKTPITILSMLILCCLSALLTYFILLASDVIVTDNPDVVVTIEDSSKVYDGNPLNSAKYEIDDEFLDKTHRVVVTFNNSITNVGTEEISVNVDILDKNNNVVTDDYDLIIKTGKYEILPKNLTISLNSVEKEYDGKPLDECDFEITLGELVPGHVLVPLYKNEITEIGSTDAKVQAFIYDLNGTDVTNNYGIKIEDNDAQLVVKKINLEIVPKDLNFEYNGVALSKDLFEFETIGLLPEHKFVLTSLFEPSKYAFANNTIIKLSDSEYDIVDSNDKSVKDYYNIVVAEKGTATVYPCNVVVNLDYTTTYTGEAVTLDPNDLMIALKGNDKVSSASFTSKYINVCQSQLAAVDLVILNNRGENVTAYYNFEYNTRLTINPKTVTVKYSKVYQYSAEPVTLDTNKLEVLDLITGHTASNNGFKNEYMYVSDSSSDVKINITVKDNKGSDVTSNYVFDYQCRVTINPYVTELSYTDEKEYDSTYYELKLDKFKSGSLLKKDKIDSAYLHSQFKNVGSYGNNVSYDVRIVDKDGNDITENYSYTTKFNVKIKSKSVKVSYSDSRVYNGTYFTEIDSSKVSISTLITGDKLASAELKNKRKIKNADNYTSVELNLKIVDSFGNDVTENYTFDFKGCSIQINPLTINILSNTIYLNFSTPEDHVFDSVVYTLNFDDIKLSNVPSGLTVKASSSFNSQNRNLVIPVDSGYGEMTYNQNNTIISMLEFYDVDGSKVSNTSLKVVFPTAEKIKVIVTCVAVPME